MTIKIPSPETGDADLLADVRKILCSSHNCDCSQLEKACNLHLRMLPQCLEQADQRVEFVDQALELAPRLCDAGQDRSAFESLKAALMVLFAEPGDVSEETDSRRQRVIEQMKRLSTAFSRG